MKVPCLNCKKRYPACQDTCPDKAIADAERQKIKEKIKIFMHLSKKEDIRDNRR